MRVRNIGEVLPQRKWTVVPAEKGSAVDFLFKFTEDPPTSSGTTREGGGPASSSGGGGDGGGSYDRFAGSGLGMSAGGSDTITSMDG